MRFDYDSADWTFVSRILEENSRRLSRTHHGTSDTGTSALKRPLLLAGQELQERARANERSAHQFLFDSRKTEVRCAEDVSSLLFRIADLTNEGLLPEGRFRTWSIEANQRSLDGQRVVGGIAAKTPPAEIPGAIERFCSELSSRWDELAKDPVPLAAWAEWELNGGKLHPFYDGCGRISRSFAAGLLVRGSEMLPLFDTPAAYFKAGDAGTFVEYYRERIEAAQDWV